MKIGYNEDVSIFIQQTRTFNFGGSVKILPPFFHQNEIKWSHDFIHWSFKKMSYFKVFLFWLKAYSQFFKCIFYHLQKVASLIKLFELKI